MQGLLVRFSLVSLALAGSAGCDESSTGPPQPLPAVSVVIVSSSCQGLDLCGQCPIEVLILDKNTNPTQGTIAWTTSDASIGVVNEFGRFHGFRQGAVSVRAEVVETGVFDEAVFQVPDCSGGL
jgi:hypothetical protein